MLVCASLCVCVGVYVGVCVHARVCVCVCVRVGACARVCLSTLAAGDALMPV